ncbi:helix-turn-helix domain-containing protein [Macrococcus lamae]|uniref:Cupin domain-containing protein n=1 Tax=Macrococcus lamae TaxID=198484 RepID=A0A4R6BUH0_9STAP|nr:cupin domain-containing protein [Macrococcus lamae]TDM11960.1 cupin domain-containing protein [Macrococcus lamae]
MTLGERIRLLRKERKLTLKYVSNETNLSIAFLSQLETNKCNATMATLRKIADVLNIHPSLFFEYDEPQNELTSSTADFDYLNLSNNVDAIFTPLKVIIKPGSNINETVTHSGHEFVYCLSGILTLIVSDQQYQLSPGQSYLYDAELPHYWFNHTNELVEFLVVNETKKN